MHITYFFNSCVIAMILRAASKLRNYGMLIYGALIGNGKGPITMKTYLFDFDGTLVDSMPTFSAIMLQILDENHITYNNDIVKVITPLGYKGTAELFSSMGLAMEPKELIALMQERAVREYAERIPAKKNVIPVLSTLKEQGAELNVLTASPHTMLDPCLKRLGIFNLFTHIWSCDDFNTTKADPSIYLAAAERLGVSVQDVLFVDDNYNAGKTAKSAGMQVCGAYDESSKEYIQDIKAIVDYYVFDFSELLNLP